MISTISRRVAELEKMALSPAEPIFWVLIPALGDVTDEQAIERYHAKHPDHPTPTQWVILRGVSPSPEIAS